jgi:hypothetical protein
MNIEWEFLGKQHLPPGGVIPWSVQTWRARVPGGWLVLVIKDGSNQANSISTTFYPDPTHGWDGGILPSSPQELEFIENEGSEEFTGWNEDAS